MAFRRRKPAAIGVKAPLPGFVEPALATSIEKVPSGARWIHEIKFDGYPVQVHLANDQDLHPPGPRLDRDRAKVNEAAARAEQRDASA